MKQKQSVFIVYFFMLLLLVCLVSCTTDALSERKSHENNDKKADLSQPLSLYVNQNSTKGKELGTKDAPFLSLQNAVDYINCKSLSRADRTITQIVLLSDLFCRYPVLIQRPLALSSEKERNIRFGKNGGFIVNGVRFTVNNCLIMRNERLYEPRDIPLLYASNARIVLKNTRFFGKEGYSFIRLYNTDFECVNSKLNFSAAHNVTLITVNNSNALFTNTEMQVSANSVKAIEVKDATVKLQNSQLSMQAFSKAVAFIGLTAKIILENTQVSCKNDRAMLYRFRTTALDWRSTIQLENNANFRGFYNTPKLVDNQDAKEH